MKKMNFGWKSVTMTCFGVLFLLAGCQQDSDFAPELKPEEIQQSELKCSHNQAKTRTHELAAGDKFVFQVIPPFSTSPVPAFYYEEVTNQTIITPKGKEVRINSLGNLGEPPFIFFAFDQRKDMTINFYGALYPDFANPRNYAAIDWVTKPESGFSVNYPGLYTVGKKWKSKFTLTNNQTGAKTDVDMEYRIVNFENIRIGIGDFDAYKIEGFNNITQQIESVSWWSPELGINLRKYTYINAPGYELAQYHFAIGR